MSLEDELETELFVEDGATLEKASTDDTRVAIEIPTGKMTRSPLLSGRLLNIHSESRSIVEINGSMTVLDAFRP